MVFRLALLFQSENITKECSTEGGDCTKCADVKVGVGVWLVMARLSACVPYCLAFVSEPSERSRKRSVIHREV